MNNEGLTVDNLVETILDTTKSKLDYDNRVPVLGCGKYGTIEFTKALLINARRNQKLINTILQEMEQYLPDGYYQFKRIEVDCPDGNSYKNIFEYLNKCKTK